MKKKILLGITLAGVFVLTGCGVVKEQRTMDYLLKGYVKAYTEADLDAAKDIFPEYYLKYNEKYVNQEGLDKELKSAQDSYGDDFSISYKIDKETIFTDEELKEYNEKIKKNYNSEQEAKECYKYEGTITLKGSKASNDYSLSTIARCSFDGKWYLVRK